jgi:hypothetical protein
MSPSASETGGSSESRSGVPKVEMTPAARVAELWGEQVVGREQVKLFLQVPEVREDGA